MRHTGPIERPRGRQGGAAVLAVAVPDVLVDGRWAAPEERKFRSKSVQIGPFVTGPMDRLQVAKPVSGTQMVRNERSWAGFAAEMRAAVADKQGDFAAGTDQGRSWNESFCIWGRSDWSVIVSESALEVGRINFLLTLTLSR